LAGDELTPTSGMLIQAWVGEALCGEGQTQEVDGQIVYGVIVYAAGSGAVWSIDEVHEHNLDFAGTNSDVLAIEQLFDIYLPFMNQ